MSMVIQFIMIELNKASGENFLIVMPTFTEAITLETKEEVSFVKIVLLML